MPISFPANPTVNQTYTYNNSVWRYDGNSWVKSGTSITGPADVSDRNNTSTGFFSLPRGTTAQRPGSAADGYMRFNTDLDRVEYYDVTVGGWITVSGVTSSATTMNLDYLVVAGGGAGGNYYYGGGGGAGGFRTGTAFLINIGSTYTITVGAGGAGTTSDGGSAASGSSSTFASITSNGGGGGGAISSSGPSSTAGSNGGSGGGGNGTQAANPPQYAGAGGLGNTPSQPSAGGNGAPAVAYQGFNGGAGLNLTNPSGGGNGSGGGGAGGAGLQPVVATTGGAGGPGQQ
jgi:hypothetical protein